MPYRVISRNFKWGAGGVYKFVGECKHARSANLHKNNRKQFKTGKIGEGAGVIAQRGGGVYTPGVKISLLPYRVCFEEARPFEMAQGAIYV